MFAGFKGANVIDTFDIFYYGLRLLQHNAERKMQIIGSFRYVDRKQELVHTLYFSGERDIFC